MSAAIPGIAGLGHMLLTGGFVLFFVALGRSLRQDSTEVMSAPVTTTH